jgi:hypothetical protein
MPGSWGSRKRDGSRSGDTWPAFVLSARTPPPGWDSQPSGSRRYFVANGSCGAAEYSIFAGARQTCKAPQTFRQPPAGFSLLSSRLSPSVRPPPPLPVAQASAGCTRDHSRRGPRRGCRLPGGHLPAAAMAGSQAARAGAQNVVRWRSPCGPPIGPPPPGRLHGGLGRQSGAGRRGAAAPRRLPVAGGDCHFRCSAPVLALQRRAR